jgi:hypothetical protein
MEKRCSVRIEAQDVANIIPNIENHLKLQICVILFTVIASSALINVVSIISFVLSLAVFMSQILCFSLDISDV